MNLVVEGNLIKEPRIKEWVGYSEINKGYCSIKRLARMGEEDIRKVTALAGLSYRPMAFCRERSQIMVTWWERDGKIKTLASLTLFPSNNFLSLLLLGKQTNKHKQNKITKRKPKRRGACGQNQYRLALWSTELGVKGVGSGSGRLSRRHPT